MKHIKKKLLFQIENFDGKIKEGIDVSLDDNDIFKKSKDNDVYIVTTENVLYEAFVHKNKIKTVLIPIPNLSLVYFDTAYNFFRSLKNIEKIIYEKSSLNNKKDEAAVNEIYNFCGLASSCIIMLFTSIESFINQIIPNEKPYIKICKSKTEAYDKLQIQQFLQFDEKTKDVLPYFFKKSFFSKQTKSTQHITNLKEIRNIIVHTKSAHDSSLQKEIIKKMITFNYEDTFKSVACFMNFYKNDFITECDCNNDF